MQQNNINNDNTTLLAKAIRDSGHCSRKEARVLIDKGEVKVNGEVAYSPCKKIKETDTVTVEGKKITLEQKEVELWLYNKPTGLITTHKDPKGRRTIFDALPKNLPKLISIGRLDLNSSGLLLLTNSGDFSRFMELPKNKLERTYKVRVFGKLDTKALKEIEEGCTIDGIKYGKTVIKHVSSSKNNHWLTVTITEGKNREVRKLLEHAQLPVSKLVRVSYGPLELGDLKTGEVRKIQIPKKLYENYCRKS